MSDATYQDALTRLRNGPQQGPKWTIAELRAIAQSLGAQATPGTTTIPRHASTPPPTTS